jgi:hypothetical protein
MTWLRPQSLVDTTRNPVIRLVDGTFVPEIGERLGADKAPVLLARGMSPFADITRVP